MPQPALTAGPHGILFEPLQLGALRLANRLAVAPMTRVSASPEGLATPPMAAYYGAFAQGGFGLVITEGAYTDRQHAQGYLRQPGLADAAQREAWRPVVRSVQGQGGRIVAQLMHAGALSQTGAATLAPSAVQPVGQQMRFYCGEGSYPMPRAMTDLEIKAAIQGFADAASRAREAGFDGVEIHAANGYLLDQFLTGHTNLRTDAYGAGLQGRLRLTMEVGAAVRQAVGGDFVVGLRISQGKVNDFGHKWRGEGEALAIFETLGGLAIDYLHTTEHEAWKPAFGTAGASLAALARARLGVPVLSNGSLHQPQQAAGMLARGEADFVSLGRGALAHADWPHRVAEGLALEAFDAAMLSPLADLEHAGRHARSRAAAG